MRINDRTNSNPTVYSKLVQVNHQAPLIGYRGHKLKISVALRIQLNYTLPLSCLEKGEEIGCTIFMQFPHPPEPNPKHNTSQNNE